jgi:uncharacterized protein
MFLMVAEMLSRRSFAPSIRFSVRRLFTILLLIALASLAGLDRAGAGATLQGALAALARKDYVAAVHILAPIAQSGNAEAQAYMGSLYAKGRGVQRDYTQAAIWYRRAAEQGQAAAQYELGMLYNYGQGVPEDVVEAEKWLIIAAAGSPKGVGDEWARIRDAVQTRLTRGELAQARMRALAWASHPEQ